MPKDKVIPMFQIDPYLARLAHEERLRQAAERHLAEQARAGRADKALSWLPRLTKFRVPSAECRVPSTPC